MPIRPSICKGKRLNQAGVSLLGCRISAGRSYIGSKLRLLSGSVASSTAASKDVSVEGYYLLAFRNVDGTDPVMRVGEFCVLKPSGAIRVKNVLRQQKKRVSVATWQAIPEDAALAGAVCLYQLVLLVGGDRLLFSEVYGTEIRADRPQRISDWTRPKTFSSPPTYSPAQGTQVLRAAYKWIGANPEGKPAAGIANEISVMIQSMLEASSQRK